MTSFELCKQRVKKHTNVLTLCITVYNVVYFVTMNVSEKKNNFLKFVYSKMK